MPSPIAHATAAYAVYRGLAAKAAPGSSLRALPTARLFGAALFLSMLPDLRSVAGLWSGDLARVHNTWDHSLVVGLVAGALAGWLLALIGGGGWRRWVLLGVLCYELHVVMDCLTVGRGSMLLWPLSAERYSSPLKLFYGLHWSDGWLSSRHLWTALSEAAFALAVGLVFLYRRRWGTGGGV